MLGRAQTPTRVQRPEGSARGSEHVVCCHAGVLRPTEQEPAATEKTVSDSQLPRGGATPGHGAARGNPGSVRRQRAWARGHKPLWFPWERAVRQGQLT